MALVVSLTFSIIKKLIIGDGSDVESNLYIEYCADGSVMHNLQRIDMEEIKMGEEVGGMWSQIFNRILRGW